MKLDAEVFSESLDDVAKLSKGAEESGFDCVWFNEIKHDPFVQLALASTSTSRIGVGTSIALAFTRSPTTLAYSAWDIQGLSRGRLTLGLGTQVKGHIERRFGGRWESPSPKMREVVGVLRAVWRNWQEGEKLDFRGRFFSVDLMTPFFSPGPVEDPAIPIYLAGVNPGMCKLAGEVGEGLHVHPLHTVRYLREVVVPAFSKGVAKSGRERSQVSIAASVFGAVGDDAKEEENVRESYRSQIAFYASTRTYRRLMELHGWGDVCERLHALSVKGEWERMPGEISDEILHEFVTRGTWDEIGQELRKKYDGLVDRVRLYLPYDGDGRWKTLVERFRA